MKRQKTFTERAAYGLFWSWNLIFLAFMVLGFAPRLLPEVLHSVRSGLTPVIYLIDGVVLSIIPVVAIVFGLTVLRGAPARLFALGYVVEGPLMLLLAIRFFLIRQATPGLTALLSIAGLGMAGFLWYVLDSRVEHRGRWLTLVRLVGLTLMLLTSLYAAVWIAFYAVPALAGFLRWLGDTLLHLGQFLRDAWYFIRDITHTGVLWIPFAVLGFLLAFYTGTLVVFTPIAVPLLSIRAFRGGWDLQVKRQGIFLPAAAVLLTVAVTAVLFVTANRQPQKEAFALLRNVPASPQQAQVLLAKQEQIRQGLLNSYLAPFRYISAVGEVRHIGELYRDLLRLPGKTSWRVQGIYESIARPLLYDPVHPQDPENVQDNLALQREPGEAAWLYQAFFDETIVDGERKEIVRAVTSTWSASQAEAAWQAADDREVCLVEQEITVQEHGDWADIELYEVYENRTEENQEVIYYFNLPESAVITGLWLGESPERSERFAFQIAPRGAAQAVYRNETRRQSDPALLEQIGPRQYRLRVFPVPPISVTWNADQTQRVAEVAPPLYLWMTYRTLAVDGAWPMPNMAYKNNVFWDNSTVRKLNGKVIKARTDAWVPQTSEPAGIVNGITHRADFAGGVSVLAQPVAQASVPELPQGIHLALIVDRSLSMREHTGEVVQAAARVQEIDPQADVYLTSSAYRGEAPSRVAMAQFDAQAILYYGGQNPGDLLAQFESMRAGRTYDGVIVLTDGSAYELGESQLDIEAPVSPVWLVHLGSDIPLGYDDKTLEVIQASGGGVEGNLQRALDRLAAGLAGWSTGAEASDVVDGYAWTVLPTKQADGLAPGAQVHSAEDSFTAVLARRWVMAEIRRKRGTITELETLDQLHVLATQYGIVTPFSSMIVLVNERQAEALEIAENREDRFEREYEGLINTTPLVGIPEPEEWVLIGIGTIVLAWYVYRSRTAHVS